MLLDLDLRQSFIYQSLSAVFGCPSNDLSTFTSQQNYIQLFMVIYLLSNNLQRHFSENDELFGNLDSVFATVPAKLLESLLHRRLASIRAAFETFLELAGAHNQRDAFQFLLKVGATYGWLAISAKGHLFLFYAASMNLASAVRTLLDNGCRPDSWNFRHPNFSFEKLSIVEALICGHLRCAQLLLERCDVDKILGWDADFPATNFEYFLYRLDDMGEFSETGLKLFLHAGADLNHPISMSRVTTETNATWRWELSIVEYFFHFHRPLLRLLRSSPTRVQNGRLSRIGILLSLDGGIRSLEAYLGSLDHHPDQQQLAKLFRQLIFEQFCIFTCHQKPHTDLETLRTLVGFGMRFGAGINEVICHVPQILRDFLHFVKHNCGKTQIEAVLYLLQNGATMTGEVLSLMARLPDTGPLHLALGSIKDLTGLEYLVADAAAQHKFDAIETLIHAGARLDTDLLSRHLSPSEKVSIITEVVSQHNRSGLSQVLDFLTMKGAPLRFSRSKPHLHHLLQSIIDGSMWVAPAYRIELVQYVISAGYDLRHSPFPTAPLLEASGTTQAFEYLYRNGAQLRPGSPLSVWIDLGGGIELCREMLKAGADSNAYSRRPVIYPLDIVASPLQVAAYHCRVDIVEVLLQAGSDINAPAKGENGFSALQASCRSRPESLEDQQRKLRTICLLLANGADVNAAPARVRGSTALQEVAASGDLAVAKLLLFHNPMADVNAPRCEHVYEYVHDLYDPGAKPEFGTALDCAAGEGRIDMVQLLLNCNALSHRWGKTGYDGAIEIARSEGYLAIADLICQHAENAKRSGASPDLSQPRRDYHEYGYDSNADETSEYSEDEFSTSISN